MIKNREQLASQIKQTTAYIFDLDGTIVDLEKLNFNAFSRAIEEHARIQLTPDEYQIYISGRGPKSGLNAYLVSHAVNTDVAPHIQIRFREIKEDELLNHFSKFVVVVDGFRDFAPIIKHRGYTLALATSTGRRFTNLILKEANLDVFDLVLTRNDIKNAKPSPEIYLKVLEKLNLKPESAIVFEDSQSGIASAQQAGLFTVGILTEGRNDEYIKGAEVMIDSYKEMLQFFTHE